MKNIRRGGKIWRVGFTEFREKVRNSRKIHFFHENCRKSVNSHENPLFRVAGTPESAESTKQYEFPLRIGGISTRNHVFTGNPLLARKTTSRAKIFSNAQMDSRARVTFPRREGAGNTNLELRFKA